MTRRHLVAMASIITGAVVASGGRAAARDHWGWDDHRGDDGGGGGSGNGDAPVHHCFLKGTRIRTPDGERRIETITRHNVEVLREIEYFHVKLDRHDVIYAEGVACETMRGAAEAKGDYLQEEYQRVGEEFPARLEASCAPILSYYGGRGMLRGRLRSAISPLIDVRNRLDVMRDDLEERALSLVAQAKQASPHPYSANDLI
jgi:hypothetical protein